ncbi:hypothetical protein D3C81_484890 [compost metagenome]
MLAGQQEVGRLVFNEALAEPENRGMNPLLIPEIPGIVKASDHMTSCGETAGRFNAEIRVVADRNVDAVALADCRRIRRELNFNGSRGKGANLLEPAFSGSHPGLNEPRFAQLADMHRHDRAGQTGRAGKLLDIHRLFGQQPENVQAHRTSQGLIDRK